MKILEIKEIKEYLRSLRLYILFSAFVFITGILLGCFFVSEFPEETRQLIEDLKEFFTGEEEMTNFEIFLFILENNISKLFIILLLGIFAGIIPLIASFANGIILGIIGCFVVKNLSWQFFLAGILPHGIIEIPVLILSTAMGMKIGKIALWKLFGKNKKVKIKKELAKALKFYIMILAPLLILAAAIEAFITTEILRMF